MTDVTTKSDSFEPATAPTAQLFDNWFDPIEHGMRERVREFIEALICSELDEALARRATGGPRLEATARRRLLATGMAAAGDR